MKMESTRLDQMPAGYFANLFDKQRITIHRGTYRAGAKFNCENNCTHYGELKIEGEFPFNFSLLFPATESGVSDKYIDTAKSILDNLAEMDSLAREPIDGDDIPDEMDMDQDVYLAYVHVENNRVELQYYWETCNAEWAAIFLRKADGSWEYVGT